MDALPILEGQFSEEEAQEVADAVCDEIAPFGGLELRWKIEAAVKAAFGYEEET